MSLSDMQAWDMEHGWRYDTAARHHVEHGPEDLATTTFGPLHLYEIHEPVEVEAKKPLVFEDGAMRLSVWSVKQLSGANDNVRQVAEAATERMRRTFDGVEHELVPGTEPSKSGGPPWRTWNWVAVEQEQDRGPYITTYTGRFYMFDPRPEDWCIADVAHGLANICRYTGAGNERYSVAEHCVHIYRILTAWGCSPDVRLAGLTHDAPESLSGFGDVASPAKKRAPVIKETEENIFRKAIAPKLHLEPELPASVHMVDMRICHDEMTQNLWEVDPKVGPPLGITLEYWEPARAEVEYLNAFREVQRERQEQARAA